LASGFWETCASFDFFDLLQVTQIMQRRINQPLIGAQGTNRRKGMIARMRVQGGLRLFDELA
jgi:hypothetical protein